MANTTEHITARLPQEVAAWLRKRSEVERRSLAFIVERALRYHMLHPELEFNNWLEDKPPLMDGSRGPAHAESCKCLMCKPPK